MKRRMKAVGKCHPSNCPTDRECRIAFIILGVIVATILVLIFI